MLLVLNTMKCGSDVSLKEREKEREREREREREYNQCSNIICIQVNQEQSGKSETCVGTCTCYTSHTSY